MELEHLLHLVRELRERHVRRVVRALAAYAIVAGALVEVTEPVLHALHLPDSILTFVVIVLGLGFPLVAVVAWASTADTAGVTGGTVHGGIATPAGTPATVAAGRRVPAVLLVLLGFVAAAPGLLYFLVFRGRDADVGEEARSIAVLPFADLSAAKDQEYFADGMAEEILNALAQVEGLRVVGRTSSFSFKGKPATTSEIGRQLNVRKLLEGSVRKEGNRVRVAAQLVDVPHGDRVWSETYDRELTGVFAVQDEIAHAVVEALKVKILPGRPSDVNERRTTNPEAYNAYLLGKHSFDLGTADGMRRAVAELDRAVTLEPSYAPGWAWLSVSILNSEVYLSPGTPTEVERAARRALEAAERAVALGPDLADSWSARAWMRTSLSWDWSGARSDFDRALALAPRDTNILLRWSHLLGVLGQMDEAIAEGRKVIEIDPLYAWGWDFLASYYLRAKRPDLARDAATRALEIAPEHLYALQDLGAAELLLGKPAEALATFRRPPSEPLRLAGIALAEQDLGDAGAAQQALDALETRFGSGEPYEIALVHAWRGDRDGTFAWLDRALEQHGGRGFSRLAIRAIKREPLLGKVRDDPRFRAVLARMGLPAD